MSDDLMSDVRAAASAVGGEGGSAGASALADVKQAAAEVAQPAEAPAATRARDEAGRFAGKPKDAAAPSGPTDAAAKKPETPAPAVAAQEPASEEAAAKPEVPARKAPQSWKPQAREKWGSVPPEIQEEVARIDKEVSRVLHDSAQARKFHEGFEKVLTPYRAIIQGEPLKVVDNLLQTAAALQTGTPANKAALVARIVQDFGVPIEALDAALSGQQPPQGAQQAPPQYRDPRLDSLLAEVERGKQRRAQEEQARIQQEVAAIEGKEFIADVRDDMADMMELAARRGVALSMEDAYNRAIRLHPEVSKVLAGRESAASANATQASTQRARHASSSVKTEPARGAPQPRSGSTFDDVRAAAAALSGR